MSQQSTLTAATSTSTTAAAASTHKGTNGKRVVLTQDMPARVIIAHVEAGRTDRDTVVEFLTTAAYPLTEVAQLAGLLGAEFATVLQAQQDLVVVKAAKAEKAPRAKSCPLSRQEFLEHATPIELTINGVPMTAGVKEFSTGSLGYNLTGKLAVVVNGKAVTLQLGVNMTVIGSKDLPQ
ncbi:MAG: hypothetical protein WCY34_02845 [Candidatus Omnitrophota bacterium]